MTSTNKSCAVLHCESGSSPDVEFFDFPQPNDPRYGIWIERTLQGSQWTPSATSTVCSRHFREADILTTEAADDSGRTEKRLKYDALPCVFECLPESERPQAAYVPRPDSPEIIYQAPKQLGSGAGTAVTAAGNARTAPNVASVPTSSVDEDPNVCCVPSCPSRGLQGVVLRSVPAVRFHPFPTDPRLHWEWTKRVRCSISWQPGPSAVVCSAHFVATDYELSLISGMLFLKPTAIPRQLACVGVFMMRRTESPGPSDRMCAICGCWRMRNQKHYKAAARLAFVSFPTDPDEREKWNALRKGISGDADLFACENHFLLNEIASRFQESGEEKFTVRSGVMPRVEPTLWLDPPPSRLPNAIPRTSAMEDVSHKAQMPVLMHGTVSNTQPGPKLVVLLRNGIPTPTVQVRSVPGMLPVARNVESTIAPTEACCVPGCSVTASNAGVKGVSMLRFISRANSDYTTWINRIRCATTWVEKYPLAICSKHFLPEDFDPLTQTLLPNALPSQLSCVSAFHFSGLREGETDVTGMLVCVACSAKRNPSLTKSSEWLKLFPFPADLVRRTAWCKFVSAHNCQTVGQNFDADTLICENHFLPADFSVGGAALKQSAVPSCTFRLQPQFRPLPYIRIPLSTVKTVSNISGTQPTGLTDNSTNSDYQCCVSGCRNDWIREREKVTFFKFVAADDPRYETWLERVRPNRDWSPDSTTMLCSDHFLPSQIILRVMRGATKRTLSATALPSLLNGECRWQPNELEVEPAEEPKRFGYNCCMTGCENKLWFNNKNKRRLGSKEVSFFRFVAANDPRYETWLHRVRPNDAWIPDIHTRICSAHFLPTQTKLNKNGSGKMMAVLSSSALPSLVDGETKWESTDIERHRAAPAPRNTDPTREPRNKDTNKLSCKCCVVECGNVRGQQKVKFFRFPTRNDPRYEIWLERVRPNDSWIPDSETRICSAHFLSSQAERQKSGHYEWTVLNCKALPSLLNGECIWEPNELLDGTLIRRDRRNLCCVSGCGNRCSQKVSLFQFVKPNDPRYETWLTRVRSDADWIPNGESKICSEHFLPSQMKTHTRKKRTVIRLSRTALPSRSDGKTMWEPANFRSVTPEETESDTRRFQYSCCVPGCGNFRNRIGSKNVSLFKFVAPEDVRYNTWLRRLRYNSMWTPKPWARVCSDHFLESDFKKQKQRRRMRHVLESIAIPSQLSCMTTLCGFTESDMISEKIGCVICGLIPSSRNRELKRSERLQFYPCPNGQTKTKWIDFVIGSQATQIDSGRLAENASWCVCENHFVPESFEPQTEEMNEARCLLADAVPSVPFTLQLDYFDPMLKLIEKGSKPVRSDSSVTKDAKRRKKVDDPSVFNPNPSNYSCVVPGCPMSSRTASRFSSERVTFHMFPSRSSTRFSKWAESVRCAVSWNPNPHDRVCNLHFLPGNFVEETSKGKQPRTRQIKKTTVPSQLQCMDKFRSSREMDSVHDGQIQTCCICGCWRSVEKVPQYQRSERLTFFPFPVDEDQREMWVEVCRKAHPDFRLSEESVVCENHFQPDDLICVLKDKRTTKLVLDSGALPSGQNFAWPGSDYDDNISESHVFHASDVDMEETMDDGMVNHTETDYDDAVDTQSEPVSFEYENSPLPSSAVKCQIAPDNGLPDNDRGDTIMNAMHLLADLPSALPSCMEDEPTKSPQVLLAANGALMYCANCQVFLHTPCWLHSNVIPDEPVISLAVGSLPNVLYMDVCDDSSNGKAVFAKDTVPRHTVFGPLVAPLTAEEDASAQYFAISEAGTGSRRKHYHFESDYACNWMKYVRWADSMEASNVLVFARGLEIVFVTSRTISSHDELRVWYSAQYIEMITEVKPFIPDLHPEREATVVKPDAMEFMDILDDGASLCDLEGGERDVSNVSFQNLPVTILPANVVPPLPEIIHSDLDVTMGQPQNRQKRSRALRDDTSCYLNRNICTECSTRFRMSDMLELHKYSHSQSKSMTTERPERQCPECRKEFPDFDELLQHVNNHGTKLVACPVCNDLCSTTTLTIHVKRYHPESFGTGKRIAYLDCHECGLRFTNACLYRMHNHKHGAPESAETVQFPEKCPECKEGFKDVDNLVEHVAGHGKPIGKCPVCEEWYGALRSHILHRHPTYPIPPRMQASEINPMEKRMKTQFDSVTCYECCLRFSTDHICQLHKCKHGNAEFIGDLQFPQKCPECNELFDALDQLVKHVDDHGRNIKKCPVCRHWFASLINHTRRKHPAYHARRGSQRGYRDKNGLSRTAELFCTTCSECGMRFPMGYLCQLHNIGHGDKEIVSTLELPMMCPQCEEVCEDLDELIQHVDLHGKTSQKCPVCDLWVGFLSEHMRRKHPDYDYLPESEDMKPDKRSQKHLNFTCLTCGVRFPTEILRRWHSFQHRTGEDKEGTEFSNECPQCDRVFQDLSKLAQHVDEHGTALKKCPVCKSWFAKLRTHMRHSHPDYSKNLTCRDCGVRFQTDALYQLHKYKHKNKDAVVFPQICPECGESFGAFDNLMDHIEQHGNRTEKCPVCHQWYGALKMHMHRYHPVPKQDSCTDRRRSYRKRSKPLQHFTRLAKRYKAAGSTCHYCAICFPAESLCQLHLFKHGRKEYAESLQFPQECPECCEVFQELHELVEHVEKHGERVKNGKVRDESLTEAETETCDDDSVSRENAANDNDSHKGHECPECGKKFRLSIGLHAHLKTCRQRIKCVICSETFESKSDFDQHFASHETDGGFLCGICLEKFSFYRLLVPHVEKHGSEDPGNTINQSSWPFKCILCHNGFASSDELSKHVKGHERRDGFTCEICSEKFPFYRLLARHVSDEHRPADASAEYSCTICDSAFARLNDLEIHLFTHDAELQFVCEQQHCGKRFVSMKSLQGHVSGFHKKREASSHKPLKTKRKKGW